LEPETASGANFNIKAAPAADSTSCEDDVTLAGFDNILLRFVPSSGAPDLVVPGAVGD
jgi:hypothetical protein